MRFPPGSQLFGFAFETTIELNKEKLAEVTAIIDAAKARGDDPRHAAPALSPTDNPEFFDYVVYNQATVGRPSPLLPDPRQVPTAKLRCSEHLRVPLTEITLRADEKFASAEPREDSH
jgi:hypothetical protein